jgi:uncharacterized protein YxjI
MQAYTIRRCMLVPGRSYWVEDGSSAARLFRIAGKVRFARTFSIRDVGGIVLYSVREKLWALESTFIVKRDGVETAVVRKTTTSGATRDLFEIHLSSGELLHASGKLWDETGVVVKRNGNSMAFVRRVQYVMRERYNVEVVRSADQALMLAIAMSIVETDLSRGDAP